MRGGAGIVLGKAEDLRGKGGAAGCPASGLPHSSTPSAVCSRSALCQ